MPWAPMLKVRPLKSNGRPVRRSTVAPSEPSSTAASDVLRTSRLLNNSEANTEKSKPRPRLVLPLMSDAPVAVTPSMPLMRTRVKPAFRPRTVICLPSPPSPRVSDTPGTRCSDSARLASGNLAMSSALITSTMPSLARLVFSALFRLARKPVTTTTCSSALLASLALVGGVVSCAWALMAASTPMTASTDGLSGLLWFRFFMRILL